MSLLFKKTLERMPTIFHITHYEAGLEWVYAVFNTIVPERIIAPEIESRQVSLQPIIMGRVYPCVCLPYDIFVKSVRPHDYRVFIIVRDLRDTLVSHYFSIKRNPEITDIEQKRVRDALQAMSVSDGLIHFMEHGFYVSAEIQRSWLANTSCYAGWPWLNTDYLLVRYEDLKENPWVCFRKILYYCNLRISENELEFVLDNNPFEKFAVKPEEESMTGDWRNYFDDQVAETFIRKFGHLLIETGYESDTNWH